MIIGLGTLVLLWGGLFTVIWGVGILVSRAGGLSDEEAGTFSSTFWMGFAGVLGFLQLWHFVAPVGLRSFFVVGLVGAGGVLLARSSLWVDGVRRVNTSPFGARAVALLLFALWLANRAMGPVTPPGDSGIYQIGSVIWSQAYAIVPGLGNLHGRFAFNNAHLLYLAMLDLPDWLPAFHHVGSGLLLLVVTAEAWGHLLRVRANREAAGVHELAGALLPAGLVPYYFLEAGGTSTDVMNLILGLVMGLRLLRLLFDATDTEDRRSAVFQIIVLAAAGTCVKLSFAFLGVPAVLVATASVLRAPGTGARRRHVRSMVVAASLATMLVVPWMARSVILSGYIAYPSSTQLGLDVDWAVAPEQVEWQNKEIRAWARHPVGFFAQYPFGDNAELDAVNQGWSWFLPWFRRTVARADIFTAPLIMFLVAVGVYARAVPRLGGAWRRSAAFLVVPLISLILWFVTAPAERFAGATFWLLGAGTVGMVCREAERAKTRAAVGRAVPLLSVGLVLITFVASAALSHSRYGWAVFVDPGDAGGFHTMPEPRELRVERT